MTGTDARDLCTSGDAAEVRRALQHPLLVQAQIAVAEARFEDAEAAIGRYVSGDGRDAAAMMVHGAILSRCGRLTEAADLLREAVALVPDLTEARLALASVLFNQSRTYEAVAVLDLVLEADPSNIPAASHRMWGLANTGRYGPAREACEAMLRRHPADPFLWISYGHLLKASVPGRASAAYRRALALSPNLGEAWWSLANLQTERLTDSDVNRMGQALQGSRGATENEIPLHFAIGRALEDLGQYEKSFRLYERGNALRRVSFGSHPVSVEAEVDATITLATPTFFEAREGKGCPAADPIFIVGMPRAGTTLVEQILASHSAVEGTAELPHLSNIVQWLVAEHGLTGPDSYPRMIARLDSARLASIGEHYLDLAKAHRHSDRPYFIDKMPSNWRYIALIKLILPNARIIDVRRPAMDCCFANYRHLFGGGHEFAYSLTDLGNHYRQYARSIDHMDEVLKGNLVRISYEGLVEDSESTIRRLLGELRLPFEQDCLLFFRNSRAVSTPSAEQVRRPINREGFDRWRHYASWLGPLADVLGGEMPAR